jgi:hypothetical protein
MKTVQSFVKDTAKQTLREVMSMSVYCHAHPLTSLRRTLTKQQVVTSRDLRRMLSDVTVRHFPESSRSQVMYTHGE